MSPESQQPDLFEDASRRVSPSRPKPPHFRYRLDYSKRRPGTKTPFMDLAAYEEFMTKIRKRT
jgi:hypothetical protein